MKKDIGLPTVEQLLRAVGFKFAVDYDGSLQWTAPESIDVAKLKFIVEHGEAAIAREILSREVRLRRCCYGGPMDGRRHAWLFHYLGRINAAGEVIGYAPHYVPVRVNRAKWATYRLQEDGRAFFVGYATSERKARRGEATQPQGESKS